jgi:hypothetical protein
MVVVFLRAPLMPMLMAHFSAPNGKGATGGRALLQKFTLYIQYDILRGEIGTVLRNVYCLFSAS